jgi:hypothetical protein
VFPLCVGLETAADQAKVPLLWPSPAVTQLLGSAVVRVLQSGGGPDELMAALPALPEWEAAATQGIPFTDVGDETVPDVSYDGSLFALRGPEENMTVAVRALCSRLPWVVQVLGNVVGMEGRTDWFFGSRSMLSWNHFAALFDGRWQHWEWTVSDQPAAAAAAPHLLHADDTLPPTALHH